MIRLENITKRFGELEVLHGITLEIDKGEVVCVIGPSGSGKSTMLRCINHLEAIDGGGIFIDGKPVYRYQANGRTVVDSPRQVAAIRAAVGMVFQAFNLFPHLTVLANLVVAPVNVLKEPSAEVTARARALLDKVGLAEKADAYPHQLSGGQQQRVAIARALAMRPKAMLFDEVTSALDPELVGEVLGVMRQLARDGMTMIVVTHEMAFAEDVADEVIVLDYGSIVEQGPPSRVLLDPQSVRARAFLSRLLDRSARHSAVTEPA